MTRTDAHDLPLILAIDDSPIDLEVVIAALRHDYRVV